MQRSSRLFTLVSNTATWPIYTSSMVSDCSLIFMYRPHRVFRSMAHPSPRSCGITDQIAFQLERWLFHRTLLPRVKCCYQYPAVCAQTSHNVRYIALGPRCHDHHSRQHAPRCIYHHYGFRLILAFDSLLYDGASGHCVSP